MINQQSVGTFFINDAAQVNTYLYGCVIFTILNTLQNSNLVIMCCIKSNIYIMISTTILIILSIICTILIWIIHIDIDQIFEKYPETKKLLIVSTGICFVLQLIMTFVNKIFIVQYEQIKNIYIYIAYSYELFAMLIIYALVDNTLHDTFAIIIFMYLFVLTSISAIQKHDQNKQNEQYYIILSFLMLFPTLVIIAAPSIHIFYENTNIVNIT